MAQDVVDMLMSKGHGKVTEIQSDPVRVSLVTKVNEDVSGYTDDMSDASVY